MSIRSVFTPTCLAFLALAGMLYSPSSRATDYVFAGSNTGAIPDGNNTVRTVLFTVSGIAAPVQRVRVSMTLTHSWMGDVSATLISPNGRNRLVLFSRTGVKPGSTFGNASDFIGIYKFADSGSPDWWPVAAGAVMTPGEYRPVTGGVILSKVGGCPTYLDAVFSGLAPVDSNGVWQLQITDSVIGDTGTVTAATLELNDSVALFKSSFETGEPLRGLDSQRGSFAPACTRATSDFDGNGLADFVLARVEAPNIRWYVRPNLATSEGVETSFLHGLSATDILFDMDIDGDGISDAVVWRAGAPGHFFVRRSSQPSAPPLDIALGATGDDPIESGDYNGDGLDDLAVFNAPPFGAPDGPMNLSIRDTATGVVRTIFLGNGVAGDVFVSGGLDHTGDGIADVAVQATETPTQARYTIFDGSNGNAVDTFLLGNPSDFQVPGNRVGNFVDDITVSRTVSGSREWTIRDMATGVTGAPFVFSTTGDARLTGDFDGDGLDDYAVWRSSATPGTSKFVLLNSVTPANPAREVIMGQVGDFAVATARVK